MGATICIFYSTSGIGISTSTPAYSGNLPQVDHIFPQSLLKKIKTKNPDSGKINLMKYREGDRNQLANCMLLTAEENGAGGKGDTPPEEWFRDKDEGYLERHLIPPDAALWRIERFEDFVEARKSLIKRRFSYLLSSAAMPGAGGLSLTGAAPVVAVTGDTGA